MDLMNNRFYNEDVRYVSELNLPWEKLKNKSIFISGARGLIGSFLIDVLMLKNESGLNCKIYAIGRNSEKAKERFKKYWKNNNFLYFLGDINTAEQDLLEKDEIKSVDYVLHLASNTHPVAYATEPIDTILTNIVGTNNMLRYAEQYNAERFVLASSNEIYGENRGDTEKFSETYCGYINCNTLRAGYPESKRCAEALCQAYNREKNTNVVIARFTRSYGPTLLDSDSKAMSQFIHKAVSGEDIVLKSKGTQYYSYTYVSDAVSGLLTVMLCGENGEAYNISDEKSDVMLKDLASIIAKSVNKNVIFDFPDEIESSGFSKATKVRLDSTKLQKLGWKARYDIDAGVNRTIKILKNCL